MLCWKSYNGKILLNFNTEVLLGNKFVIFEANIREKVLLDRWQQWSIKCPPPTHPFQHVILNIWESTKCQESKRPQTSYNAVGSRGTNEELRLPSVQVLGNLYRTLSSFAGFLEEYLFNVWSLCLKLSGWNYTPCKRSARCCKLETNTRKVTCKRDSCCLCAPGCQSPPLKGSTLLCQTALHSQLSITCQLAEPALAPSSRALKEC